MTQEELRGLIVRVVRLDMLEEPIPEIWRDCIVDDRQWDELLARVCLKFGNLIFSELMQRESHWKKLAEDVLACQTPVPIVIADLTIEQCPGCQSRNREHRQFISPAGMGDYCKHPWHDEKPIKP